VDRIPDAVGSGSSAGAPDFGSSPERDAMKHRGSYATWLEANTHPERGQKGAQPDSEVEGAAHSGGGPKDFAEDE